MKTALEFLAERRASIVQSGGTLRARVRRTKQRVRELGVNLPKPTIHTPPPVEGVPHQELIADIGRRVAEAEKVPVIKFLLGEGFKEIYIVSDEKVENLGVVLQGGIPYHSDLYKMFGVNRFSYGAGIFKFNPSYYAALGNRQREAVIEHELWHLYLKRVFPCYESSYNMLRMDLLYNEIDSLLVPFFSHFDHFLLRVAAAEAQGQSFVDSDCSLTFPSQIGQISQFPDLNNLTVFALYVGLIFGYVFPFKFGDARFGEQGEKNLRAIRDRVEGRIGSREERSRNLRMFGQAAKLAEKTLGECSSWPDGQQDFVMDFILQDVQNIWMDFLRNNWPGI